jgi:hypothetical protein
MLNVSLFIKFQYERKEDVAFIVIPSLTYTEEHSVLRKKGSEVRRHSIPPRESLL